MSIRDLFMRRSILLAAIAIAGAASMALADHGPAHAPMAKKTMMKKAQIGLDGYCPVCIIEAKKWERGRPEIKSTYDGTTYLFPNAQIKKKFDSAPHKYVPALGGDCTVCYAKAGKRIPGSIQHAALNNNRLFLFPSEGEKKVFLENPAAYANVDLAANGECIVCLAKMKKHVPGSPEHTVVHDGFRYLFPSNREAEVFSRSPAQFTSAVMSMNKAPKSQTTMRPKATATKLVTVSGMSACAGCEFGVTPIANPDELGLAVKTSNGQVVVIENAHKLYPQIYAARFKGQNLKVEGELLKTDGKIAWLEPTSVQVLN